jgi:hypothetical protein
LRRDLSGNAFNLTGGLICGVIPSDNLGVRVLPVDNAGAPEPPLDPQGAQHVFQSQSFQAEVNGEYIYFFAAKTFPSGRRYVFREEYLWVNVQGIAFETTNGRMTRNITAFAVAGYHPQSRTISPGVYAVDSILANGANLSTIISMGDESKVKLSYELTQINAPTFTQTAGTRPRVELSYRWAVKAPHSVMDTPRCSAELLGVLSTSGCVSSKFRSNITFTQESLVPQVRFEAVSERVVFNLTFPLDYKIDNDTSGNNLRILFSDDKKTDLFPLGAYNYLASLYAAGLAPPLPANNSDQHVALIGAFRTNELPTSRLYYDPDVSITLLFSPPEPEPGPSQVTPIELAARETLNIGLVAGLVVLAVVVVAFAILALTYPPLRHRIFPFTAKSSGSLSTIDDGDAVRTEPSKNWTKASTPSRK